MMKIKQLASMIILSIAMLPSLSYSARWWQPDELDYSGGGIDLDSYRTFVDNEGYEVVSIWFRAKLGKGRTLYNPKLGKNSITSAFSTLIQTRCETGEIKITEFIFQDRQFKELWKGSQYPDYLNSDIIFNRFYYPSPDSKEGRVSQSICTLQETEQKIGFSIKNIELDEYGHAIGVKF